MSTASYFSSVTALLAHLMRVSIEAILLYALVIVAMRGMVVSVSESAQVNKGGIHVCRK